jgi:hypothetical protein
MIYQVVIPEGVYEELEEATLHYNAVQDGLGLSFFYNWEIAVEYLKNNPLHFQKKHKQLRSIKIDRFPYLIIYEIVKNNVFVYRLIQAQMQPRKIFKK